MINFWSWNELILASFGPKYKGEINMATITRKANTGHFMRIIHQQDRRMCT